MIHSRRHLRSFGWLSGLVVAACVTAALLIPAVTAAAPPDASSASDSNAGVLARLDRLEKAVEALTAEIRAMRAADLDNAPPVVIKSIPANGQEEVDPNLTEIRVTFSKDMHDGTWSWTQRSDDTFPEVIGKIHYLDDKRTCVLPVKLQPGKSYYLSINSERFRNFKDTGRRPAVPYPIAFKTKP